jgi:hypothetical protein
VLALGVDRDKDPLSAGIVAKLYLIWLSVALTVQKSKTWARIALTSNEKARRLSRFYSRMINAKVVCSRINSLRQDATTTTNQFCVTIACKYDLLPWNWHMLGSLPLYASPASSIALLLVRKSAPFNNTGFEIRTGGSVVSTTRLIRASKVYCCARLT